MSDYFLLIYPVIIVIVLFAGCIIRKKGEYYEEAWSLTQSNALRAVAISKNIWYNIISNFISGRYIMAVSYNKLWKKLIDLEMSRSELRVKAGISTRQLAKLGKNENVTTDVLVRVCQALDCNVAEIMDITDQTEENN